MFGVKQKRLVKSAAKLAARCCAYIGDYCDCKYMTDETPETSIMSRSEVGSGCPEISELMHLVAAMTDQEFNAIAKRAGIIISNDQEDTIDANAILKEERQKRKEDTFIPKSYPEIKSSRKSAYDLNNAKASIKKALKSK